MQYLTERRSVRQFEKTTATKEEIEKILLGGFCAPSAMNCYPVQFVVVTDDNDLKRLAEAHPHSGFTSNAAFCIIPCAIPAQACKMGQHEFAIIDAALACQNLMTAGKIVGYDSVYAALYPVKELEEKVREMFNIPEGIIPLAVLSFGKKHPDCHIKPVEKYHAEKVHYGRW